MAGGIRRTEEFKQGPAGKESGEALSVALPVSWTRVKTHYAASAHAVARAAAGV